MKASGTYAADLHLEIMRVVPTYVALGLVVLLLAFFIGRRRFPADLDAVGQDEPQGRLSDLLRYPHLLLAVVAQFFYVGSQVGTWSTFIPYMKAYTVTIEKSAGYLLTGTLIALAAGRICTTPLMRFISPARLIGIYAVINMFLVFLGIAHPDLLGGYALLSSSFFMSIMFPTIFALGIKGLGPLTKVAGSLIVMAVVGGAMVPPLMGVITRQTGRIASGFWLPLAGYLVVALYGFFGSSVGARRHEVKLATEVV